MIDVKCEAGGRHELQTGIMGTDCSKCGWAPSINEEERLLNAAMQLTADEATSASKDSYTATHNPIPDHVHRLKDYATRWRGDTEEVEDE